MNRKTMLNTLLTLLVLGGIVFGEESTSPAPAAEPAPSVFFPSVAYHCKPVAEGIEVVHDFTVQNKGTAVLKIEKVRTGCGCVAVSFDREIPPGGQGKIKLRVRTDHLGGRKLHRSAWVLTNDGEKPKTKLTISGDVEVFAKITPERVRLIGSSGQDLRASVSVIPNPKYAFRVLDAVTSSGKEENIRIHLEETGNPGGKGYRVTVENRRKGKGRYVDCIVLKTDSPVRPEIRIYVSGMIT